MASNYVNVFMYVQVDSGECDVTVADADVPRGGASKTRHGVHELVQNCRTGASRGSMETCAHSYCNIITKYSVLVR